MTKSELINAVHENINLDGMTKRAIGELVEALFATIQNSIADEGRFAFPGFGTFTVKERAARTGRNPRTGQAIKIAASKTVNFKPAPTFKDAL